MFSDDDLMDMLVLKGGNALDIIYRLAQRSSKDVDFSIANEFSRKDFEKIKSKIENTLKNTFKPEGFIVFDVKLTEKPVRISPDMEKFWGGYQVEFKIIETENYNKHQYDIESLRRNATVIEKNNRKIFRIDISKFEYCDSKQEYDLDGYTIYVYSPEMINLTREDLANFVGTATETLIRLLKDFKEEALIKTHARKIEVLNKDGLLQVAGL